MVGDGMSVEGAGVGIPPVQCREGDLFEILYCTATDFGLNREKYLGVKGTGHGSLCSQRSCC